MTLRALCEKILELDAKATAASDVEAVEYVWDMAEIAPELARKALVMDEQLRVAREALNSFDADDFGEETCRRNEHAGWFEGHGDYCDICEGYEARTRRVRIGPNKAREALAKIAAMEGK